MWRGPGGDLCLVAIGRLFIHPVMRVLFRPFSFPTISFFVLSVLPEVLPLENGIMDPLNFQRM